MEMRARPDGWTWHAPVGSFGHNDFGLHDVHGNVSEWCEDWDTRKDLSPERLKSCRGGSWQSAPIHARSAFRGFLFPRSTENNRGLRPAFGIRADP